MVEENKKMLKVEIEVVKKSYGAGISQAVPPNSYYPAPTMLNFRDQTRTGVFIVVCSWTRFTFLRLLLFCYISTHLPGAFGLLFRTL